MGRKRPPPKGLRLRPKKRDPQRRRRRQPRTNEAVDDVPSLGLSLSLSLSV
jgi:hypothetical protein